MRLDSVNIVGGKGNQPWERTHHKMWVALHMCKKYAHIIHVCAIYIAADECRYIPHEATYNTYKSIGIGADAIHVKVLGN